MTISMRYFKRFTLGLAILLCLSLPGQGDAEYRFNPFTGKRDYYEAALKDKLDATVDPTVNEDSDDGYTEGSKWINVTDDCAFECLDASVGSAVWRETTRRSILSGDTFPASGDFVGQKFRANSGDYSNRDITYEWNGSVWQPKETSGAVTFYVDKTDGTDSPEKGFGVDSDAFATRQYAAAQIPGLVGGNVIIYHSSETFTENVILGGKVFLGDYTIQMVGTVSNLVSDTATSGGNNTLTKTGAGWGVNAYAKKLCRITGNTGAGQWAIIRSNTSDTLTMYAQNWRSVLEDDLGTTLVSGVNPDNTSTFVVEDWGTVFNATSGITQLISSGQKGIEFRKLKFTNGGEAVGDDLIQARAFTECKIFGCWLEGGYREVYVPGGGKVEIRGSLIDGDNDTLNNNGSALDVANAIVFLGGIGIIDSEAHGWRHGWLSFGLAWDCFIDNSDFNGILAERNAGLWGSGLVVNNNTSWGVLAQTGGFANNAQAWTYSGNVSGTYSPVTMVDGGTD